MPLRARPVNTITVTDEPAKDDSEVEIGTQKRPVTGELRPTGGVGYLLEWTHTVWDLGEKGVKKGWGWGTISRDLEHPRFTGQCRDDPHPYSVDARV